MRKKKSKKSISTKKKIRQIHKKRKVPKAKSKIDPVIDKNNSYKKLKELFKTEEHKKIDDNVKNYLQYSRYVKSKPEKMDMYYDLLVKNIWDVVEHYKRINPYFYLTYSLNRKCEMLIIDDTDVLIYDQYLGKAYNLFNKVYLQLKDPEVIKDFCRRYIAESFIVKGKSFECSIFLALCDKEKSFQKLNRAYQEKNANPKFIIIQETFIILHEIAHLILREYPRFKTFKSKEINDFINKSISLHEKGYEIGLTEKENLMEEIVCDYIALKYTLKIYMNDNSFKPDEVIEALHLGLRTLRALGILNSSITRYLDSDKLKQKHSLQHLSIRYWSFRNNMKYIIKTKYKNRFEKDPVGKIVGNDLDHFYEIYYEDPIYDMDEYFIKLKKRILDEKIVPMTFEEELDFFKDLDAALDWR